jgi:hypothetical protein
VDFFEEGRRRKVILAKEGSGLGGLGLGNLLIRDKGLFFETFYESLLLLLLAKFIIIHIELFFYTYQSIFH